MGVGERTAQPKHILRETPPHVSSPHNGRARLARYDLELDSRFESLLGHFPKKPWSKFISSRNAHIANEEAVDFVSKLLR